MNNLVEQGFYIHRETAHKQACGARLFYRQGETTHKQACRARLFYRQRETTHQQACGARLFYRQRETTHEQTCGRGCKLGNRTRLYSNNLYLLPTYWTASR